MNKSFKKIAPVLLIIPTLILLLAIYKHRHAPPRQIKYMPEELAEFQRFSDKWSNLEFIPIDHTSAFVQALDQISIEPNNILNEKQASKLHQAVCNWLYAFHDGTYESFHAFRTPVSDFTLVESVQTFLKEEQKNVPHDSEGMFKLYWDNYCANQWTNHWRQVSLTKSSVFIQKTNAALPNLLEYVKTKENIGISQSGPMLTFTDTPQSILSANKSIVYATVCIVPKGTGATFPIYCRYYWSETHDNWLPEDVATTYIGPKRLHYLF